jgi:hypothetical protein
MIEFQSIRKDPMLLRMTRNVDGLIRQYIDAYGRVPPAASFGYFVSVDERIVPYLRAWGVNCSETMETLGGVPEGLIPGHLMDIDGVVQFEKISRVFFGLVRTQEKLSKWTVDSQVVTQDVDCGTNWTPTCEELHAARNKGALIIVNGLIETVGEALQALRRRVKVAVGLLGRTGMRRVYQTDFWKAYYGTKAERAADTKTIEKRILEVAAVAEESSRAALAWENAKRGDAAGEESNSATFAPDDFVEDTSSTDKATLQMNELYLRYKEVALTLSEKVDLYMRYTTIKNERDGRQEQSRRYYLVGMQSHLAKMVETLGSLRKQKRDTGEELRYSTSELFSLRREWEARGRGRGGMTELEEVKQKCAVLKERVLEIGASPAEVARLQDNLDRELGLLNELFRKLEAVEEAEAKTELLNRRAGEIEMNEAFALNKINTLKYQISKIASATRKKEPRGASWERKKRAAFLESQEADALKELRDQLPPGATLDVELKQKALNRIRRERLVYAAVEKLLEYREKEEVFESLKDDAMAERDRNFEELFSEMEKKVSAYVVVQQQAGREAAFAFGGVLPGIEDAAAGDALRNPSRRFDYKEAANLVASQRKERTEKVDGLLKMSDEEYLKHDVKYAAADRELQKHLSGEESRVFKHTERVLEDIALMEMAEADMTRLEAALASASKVEGAVEQGSKRARPDDGGLSARIRAVERNLVKLTGRVVDQGFGLDDKETLRLQNDKYIARKRELARARAAVAQGLLREKRDKISVLEGRCAQDAVYVEAYNALAERQAALEGAEITEDERDATRAHEHMRETAQIMIDAAKTSCQDRLKGIGFTYDVTKPLLLKTSWRPKRAPAAFIKENAQDLPRMSAALKADSACRIARADLYRRVKQLYAAQCDVDHPARVDAFYAEVFEIAAPARKRKDRAKLILPEDYKKAGMRFAWSEMKGTNGWVERLRATRRADRVAANQDNALLSEQAREMAAASLQDRRTLEMQILINEIGLFAAKGSGRALAYCRLIIEALQNANEIGSDKTAAEICRKVNLDSTVNMETLSTKNRAAYTRLQELLERWQKMPTQLRGCEMPPPEFKKGVLEGKASKRMAMIHLDASGSRLRVDEMTQEIVATSIEDAKGPEGALRKHAPHRIAIPDATPIAFVGFMGRVVPVTNDLRLPRLSAPDQHRPPIGNDPPLFVFHKTRAELEQDYRRRLVHLSYENPAHFPARAKTALKTATRWGGRSATTGRSVLLDPSSNEQLLSPAVKLGLARQRADIVAMRARAVALEAEYKKARLTSDEIFRVNAEGNALEPEKLNIQGVEVEVDSLPSSEGLAPQLLAVHKTLEALRRQIVDEYVDIDLAGSDWVRIDAQRAGSGGAMVQEISTDADADGFVYCRSSDARKECGSGGEYVYDEVSGLNWKEGTRRKALDRALLFLNKWYPWVPAHHLPSDTSPAEWPKFTEFAKWNEQLNNHGCVSMVLCDEFNGLMNASVPPLRLGSGIDREIATTSFMQELVKNHSVYFVDLRGQDAMATEMPLNTSYDSWFESVQPRMILSKFAHPYIARREGDKQSVGGGGDAPGDRDHVPLEDVLQISEENRQPQLNWAMLSSDMYADQTFGEDALRLAAQERGAERERIAKLRDATDTVLHRRSTRVFRRDLAELPSKEEEERELRALVRVRMSRVVDGLELRAEDVDASLALAAEGPDRAPLREKPVFVTVAMQGPGGYRSQTFDLGEPIYDRDTLAQVCAKLREMELYRDIRLGIGTVVVDGREAKAIVELEGGRSSTMNGKVVEPLFNWIGGGSAEYAFRQLCINQWRAERDNQTSSIPAELYDAVKGEMDGVSPALLDAPAAESPHSAPLVDARSLSFVALAATLAAHDPGHVKCPLRADGTALKPLLLEKLC